METRHPSRLANPSGPLDFTMPTRSTSYNLTRQLLALHAIAFVCGLLPTVGLFAMTDNTSLRMVGVATGVALSALVFTVSLTGIVGRENRIRRQLAAVPADPESEWSLEPVSGPSAVEAGWNRLVETARHWRLLSQLEQHVESSLAESRGPRSDHVLDALTDGVVVTDEGGDITHANAAFAALCHKEPTELIGTPIDDCLPDDIDLGGSSRPLSVDVEQTDQGEVRHLRFSRRPQLTPDGEVDGHVWILRDVTQQHFADAMREQFVISATHELRTPLANIRAYAETLGNKDHIDREQQKQFFNTIQSEASRLSRFIDDLLDVSRMQAGSLVLDTHPTEVERLVNEIVDKVQPLMDEKQLTFQIELPSKLPRLQVDKGKISAGLINLLGNAAKYTPEHGRVVFQVATSSQRIEFAVSDTGIGIDPAEQTRVFERFFRSEDERVYDVSGSGIGLTFTQEVARLHGGDVTLESELNKGSTFRLVLPLAVGS